jgi:1-acyl-sn-glycerol-3-phosphate acyltransferase
VARIALETGAPVIPVGIIGTDLAFPRGARLPRPRSVRIVFGPPLRFAVPGDRARSASLSRSATEQVMAAIRDLSGQQIAEVDPVA